MKNTLILALALGVFASSFAQQATPVTPRLAVASQITSTDALVIPAVVLDKPGYVAVHGEKDGKMVVDPPLGVSALLPAGLSRNVSVPLTPLATGVQTVYPMLHVEGNGNETYNFPGPDGPVTFEGNVLMAPMKLTKVAPGSSSVTVAGGEILLDSQGAYVTVASVTLTQPGFIALHTAGADGKMKVLPAAGVSTLLPVGKSTQVKIRLDANVAVNPGDRLWAMAHADNNGNRVYEFPSTDGPITSGGAVVMAPFTVR
ncbi:DUF7282 domain-containing protein [Deinococcus hopiensis]|uniref:DUF7282 domain-containing protein n=1 Tax=Deinococcus hopiensis TaxID=309885 RepID=UPI000A01CDF9|nr:hypothetical protein [Deinococcus hopiensis]